MTDPKIIPLGVTLPALAPTPTDHAPTPRPPARATPKRSRAGAVKRRFALLNAVADEALAMMHGHDAAVWLTLYRHAKPSGETTVSVGDLARRCGCDRATAKRALDRLRKRGLVETLKRGSQLGGATIHRLIGPSGRPP
jgi:hypothetical protein